MLSVFNDMTTDMINDKKFNPVVPELFVRGRKLNISLVFIAQSYFKVQEKFRLNSTHYFIMEIPNKRKLQSIEINHSSDIGFKDFVKIYKTKHCKIIFSLVNDTFLPSDNPLRFIKNLLDLL